MAYIYLDNIKNATTQTKHKKYQYYSQPCLLFFLSNKIYNEFYTFFTTLVNLICWNWSFFVVFVTSQF